MDCQELDRLKEIRSEMMDLLFEAKNIVRQSDRVIYERAKAYWLGHIDTALGDGDYIDTYDYTMQKSIEELEALGDDYEEEEEESEEECI